MDVRLPEWLWLETEDVADLKWEFRARSAFGHCEVAAIETPLGGRGGSE